MDKKVILTGLLAVFLVSFVSITGQFIALHNQEVQLRNKIVAKQVENRSNFDNMWKKIKQTSNVSDKYKDGFKEVLVAYTENRKDLSENLLMKWGNEAVPTFDNTMYKQLNNIIVSSRNDFTLHQKELIDLKREYDNLVNVFPNSLYFKAMHTPKLEIKVVTSTKTENAFDTCLENEVNL